ncbi:MAG: enoyl-CoA hydratase/isomerase family protein [Candidatus Thorarchaeota archaeon]|jgi:enoyl-CoA hydratase/carnithine racemase
MNLDTITIEYDGSIAIVKLMRDVTNAINVQVINELSACITALKKDETINSVVLTSSNNKFFSIGFDVKELYTLSKQEFTEFYRIFNKVLLDTYTMEKPVIAGVTGHAIAGGFALTVCCDYRVIGEGRKLMGINVMKLGLSVPYAVGCVLYSIIGVRKGREMVDTGTFYQPDALLKMGMVDYVVPPEEVISKSVEMAKTLGSIPQKAYAITKRNRVEPVKKLILAHLEKKEMDFVECWFSKKARALIQDAMEKF